MMKIKYDVSLMKFMDLFSKMTNAKIKDCYEDTVLKCLVFIVQPGEIQKAVGKKGANAIEFERKTKKNIRIIEFNDDIVEFVRNMVAPLKVANIVKEDGIITITDPDVKTKGILIGRNAANLRNLESNVRRYFEVDEIKVV